MYLTQGLHRSLQETPGAPATIFGERVWTFREQADRVARLAAALRKLGVRDGERVGVLALNSDRYAEVLLAVPWANGVLNPVNIRWSPAEIIYSLTESQTTILFVDDAFAATVPALAAGYPGLTTVIHLGEQAPPAGMLDYETLISEASPVPDARRGGSELAGIFYTGGTTGFPKGVMLSHANLLISAFGQQATAPTAVPGGRTLVALPMFHLGAFAAWVPQFVVGGTQVIVPGFDTVAVLDAIAAHRITSTALLPTMVQRVVDHPALPGYDTASLRSLLYGGSPMSEALLERAMRAFPQTSFVQLYGMTELAPAITLLGAGEHRAGKSLRSAGLPAAHAEVRVVDSQDREVPRGTVGEVVCRGGHVMLGYWRKPEETATALRGGWMHTGDGGYLDDDGYLHIVDRIKDMIITGGENVYSTEVENAVSAHPAVAACAVIGVPDAVWGERVHAVVMLRPGATASTEDIRAHCGTLIAGYKKPRTCDFVDTLPLSAAGKVLKSELRKPFWANVSRAVH